MLKLDALYRVQVFRFLNVINDRIDFQIIKYNDLVKSLVCVFYISLFDIVRLLYLYLLWND